MTFPQWKRNHNWCAALSVCPALEMRTGDLMAKFGLLHYAILFLVVALVAAAGEAP